jgi:flagellin
MSVSYSSNIQSLRLGFRLKETASQISSVYERLSSGARINKGADDPAGLALAEKLNAESRMMTVALRNANDGLSVTNMADSALSEISNILGRMSELAVQAMSGTPTSTARSALQAEFAALGSEVSRISASATFNSVPLLSNSSAQVIQVGITADASSQIRIPPVSATLDSLGLGSGDRLTFSLSDTSTEFSISAAGSAYSAVQTAMENINLQRGTVGMVSNRLTAAISYLNVAKENTLAAEANVRDADIATDSSELIRLQILEQVQTSLFAQANQIPSQVLTLIGATSQSNEPLK